MAGTYISILQPGYSTLWTRDLLYTPGTNESASINPFDPNDDRPLVEGEWLEHSSTVQNRVSRGGANGAGAGACTAPGIKENEGMNPSYMYFMEQGRYDAQATKRVHMILGPYGYEFRTKLCDDTVAIPVNTALTVWDWDGPAGAWGLVRRVLGARVDAASWTVGRVVRVFGTNDVSVIFMPGSGHAA